MAELSVPDGIEGCFAGCDRTPREEAVRPTAGQMLHQLHQMSQADQLGFMQRMLDASKSAVDCFVRDHEGRLAHRDELLIEVSRLRREVEFEANGEVFDHGWMDLSLRPCACLPDDTVLPAGWSVPQCAVHPDGAGEVRHE